MLYIERERERESDGEKLKTKLIQVDEMNVKEFRGCNVSVLRNHPQDFLKDDNKYKSWWWFHNKFLTWDYFVFQIFSILSDSLKLFTSIYIYIYIHVSDASELTRYYTKWISWARIYKYNDSAVQRFNPYTTRTPHPCINKFEFRNIILLHWLPYQN